MTAFLYRLDRLLARLEQVLLTLLLSLMIAVAFTQIVLRNVFSTGISWADSLVRYLVLWVGFIGAALAVAEGKHITIDLLYRWVPGRSLTVIRAVTRLFAAAVCALLTSAAVTFVRNEALMGEVLFLGLPTWTLQLILPATFAVMTLRYLLPAPHAENSGTPGGSRPVDAPSP
jgi:TRAP-type C4-dicarboxylate transport system permease small subunit